MHKTTKNMVTKLRTENSAICHISMIEWNMNTVIGEEENRKIKKRKQSNAWWYRLDCKMFCVHV